MLSVYSVRKMSARHADAVLYVIRQHAMLILDGNVVDIVPKDIFTPPDNAPTQLSKGAKSSSEMNATVSVENSSYFSTSSHENTMAGGAKAAGMTEEEAVNFKISMKSHLAKRHYPGKGLWWDLKF